MRLIRIVITIASILILAAGNTVAQREDSVRIGTVLLPPWGYYDSQGRPQGILYEAANHIAEQLGYDYHNQVLPAARLLRDLDNNLIDFTIIYRTPNSERIGVPVARIFSGIQNIVIARSSLDLRSKDQLYNGIIAVPRGGKFGEPFDSDPLVRRFISNEYMHSVQLLAAGKVDMIVGSRQTLFYCADQLGLGLDFFGQPFLLTVTDEWVHVPRQNVGRMDPEKIGLAIEQLRQNGTLEMLEKKYLPAMYFKTEVRPGHPWPAPAE